jgi:uncharacterized protein YutE (UPF0331/DUF86 family)
LYYVNHEQIAERLEMIPMLTGAAETLAAQWPERGDDVLLVFAQERLLHLGIELVTDVGSLLIDGFIMRDASSYEDIIDILRTEGVFDEDLYDPLQQLVRLRKPLVQDYTTLQRGELHPLTAFIPAMLPQFASSVKQFMAKELA